MFISGSIGYLFQSIKIFLQSERIHAIVKSCKNMHEIVDENHNLYFDLFSIWNELLFDLNKFHLFNQRSQPVASLLNNLTSFI